VACPTCGSGLIPIGDVDGATGVIAHRHYGCIKCEKQMETYLSLGLTKLRATAVQDIKVVEYLKARSKKIAAKEVLPLDK